MAAGDRLGPGSSFAGDFEIVEPLGEGGMGALYVVRQRSTGALRALKLMQKELVRSPALREKFEQEARIGARIESDHVAQVLAAGVDAATGLPWIAMELLRGETLAARIERGPLPWPYVVAVFEQMGHALAAAHRQGIVHRDLKPENIFLAAPRTAGAEMMVKLLDFGIAKVVAESATTQTGVMGTPAFMAPEQYQGRGIGPYTDVWALGLIAFLALTGRSYWRNATGSASTPASLMFETCMEELVPASTRAAELGVAQYLPAGFDAWFARCVAREGKDRHANAGEAVARMRALGDGAALPITTGAQAIPSSRPAVHSATATAQTALAPPSSGSGTGTVATPAAWTPPGPGLVPRYEEATKPSAARRSRRAVYAGLGVLALGGIGGAVVVLGSAGEQAGVAGTASVATARSPSTSHAAPSTPIAPAPSDPPSSPSPATSSRSPVPTAADWNMVGEVTVTGSTALSCETKMIREWLRVSCRGTNDTGGTPTTVTVTRGADAHTYTFAAGNITSLVLPYVEGINAEALFSWTDKSRKLFIAWPQGTPIPAIKARFADHSF